MEKDPSLNSTSVQAPTGEKSSGRIAVDCLQNFNEKQLEALLHSIQRRLGTSLEEEGDFEYARIVAHELNNQLTVSRLKQGMELGANPISA